MFLSSLILQVSFNYILFSISIFNGPVQGFIASAKTLLIPLKTVSRNPYPHQRHIPKAVLSSHLNLCDGVEFVFPEHLTSPRSFPFIMSYWLGPPRCSPINVCNILEPAWGRAALLVSKNAGC